MRTSPIQASGSQDRGFPHILPAHPQIGLVGLGFGFQICTSGLDQWDTTSWPECQRRLLCLTVHLTQDAFHVVTNRTRYFDRPHDSRFQRPGVNRWLRNPLQCIRILHEAGERGELRCCELWAEGGAKIRRGGLDSGSCSKPSFAAV